MKNIKNFENAEQGVGLVEATLQTADLQWVKYKNERGGFGFAAEDANALSDKLHFKKVEKVGVNNEKNGADRIVNGQAIQTKYYKTANDSVNAAFDKDTGLFRYKNQMLEVPKDQYEQAIAVMEQKIRDGKVPGVTDPAKAKDLIKKGSVTYQQAKNIAKAGNIDSLLFDIKTQAVVGLYGFSIAFLIQYANCVWNGMDKKDALKVSITSGLKTGGIVLGTGVLTQQFFRTSMGRSFAAFTSSISKRIIDSLYKTEVGKKFVHKIATIVLGKQVAGTAAKNVVIKFCRTNLAMAIITTTVTTLPDFYKALIDKKISWKQFTKNLVINVSGIGGGILGGIGGKALGGMIGGAIAAAVSGGTATPIGVAIGGAIGGTVFGVGTGVLSSLATKEIADMIAKDDALVMFELVKESITDLSLDYLVTEEELQKAKIDEVVSKKVSNQWLQKMYQYGNNDETRKQFAYKEFEPVFEKILAERPKIELTKQEYTQEMKQITKNLFIIWLKSKLLFWKKDSKEIKEIQKEEGQAVLSA